MAIQPPSTPDAEERSGTFAAYKFNAIQTFWWFWEIASPSTEQGLSIQETNRHPPKTTVARRRASITERSLDNDEYLAEKVATHRIEEVAPPEETVLYLAYGSNLAAKTFLGQRGIRPLSQINVVVPSLRLTFDLPGLPYAEPCFAGTRHRAHTPSDIQTDGNGNTELVDAGVSEKSTLISHEKNSIPLVGVVYEVTVADYAKIIATEGGGRGYRDVVVDCYPFPQSYSPADPIPEYPGTKPCKSHTLLSPVDDASSRLPAMGKRPLSSPWKPVRPNPGYAQPSARYLNLITTGAAEHNLPLAYRNHLEQIKTYQITSVRQKIGKFVFLFSWGPVLLTLMTLSRVLAGPDGRSPPWLMKLADLVFFAMWSAYDNIFARVFGDGERTIQDGKSSLQ
ncbi:uncharacterized protein ACLA_032430 [Aspergillus clavatus NRRL 1]|uniref:gamma-glutamylcyclotransferase n=1 Tax=Aspergillus clavatus (strain ATCC 1007 / CBS 513.65 / DSM 816 / NCTC 3887 / NRRL 1 / QM 1276 / 107) TaxID=344612 RepID=A1CS87_ASPCL|nr:uncharacterized protein ACLA_032430 [Aspergillus clavatus NRRL 1]EAW08508.1 conserved hypothetical protein [Aspergillus clavatus NRRL 1]